MELTFRPTKFRTTLIKGQNLPANKNLKEEILQPENLVSDVYGKSTRPKYRSNKTLWSNKIIDYNESKNDLLKNNDLK